MPALDAGLGCMVGIHVEGVYVENSVAVAVAAKSLEIVYGTVITRHKNASQAAEPSLAAETIRAIVIGLGENTFAFQVTALGIVHSLAGPGTDDVGLQGTGEGKGCEE
ncbi:MAG: hypothetical protein Q9182_001191 [Xanthomendoza sp. 2 TL-2023]